MNIKHKTTALFGIIIAVLLSVGTANARSLMVLNTFTPGTPVRSADVNANFSALGTAATDNYSQIQALAATVASLQATVTTLQADNTALSATVTSQANTIANLQTQLNSVAASNVMAMDPYVSVTSDTRGPIVQFASTNVQVINGLGSTATANGLGNLIVGYDETTLSPGAQCTIGTNPTTVTPVTDSASCTSAGGQWVTGGFKTGSHYLVTGTQHSYSRWGGLLAGVQNTSNYDYASVSGGSLNVASGAVASVSGGQSNTASGPRASVSGGWINTASGTLSSVSGGQVNLASANYASVSGGLGNTASGGVASVSGGGSNVASGGVASVSGGQNNTASANYASISGGSYNTASGTYASVCGGGGTTGPAGGNTASHNYSTILGGIGKVTTAVSQSVP